MVEEVDAILDKSGIIGYILQFKKISLNLNDIFNDVIFVHITYRKCAQGLFVVSILSGTTVFAEIQGVIDACVKLSGMPDLTLSFMVSAVFHTV